MRCMSNTFEARLPDRITTKTTKIIRHVTLYGMAAVVHQRLNGNGFSVSDPISGARFPGEAGDSPDAAVASAEQRLRNAAAEAQMEPDKFIKLRSRIAKMMITNAAKELKETKS